MAYNPTLYSPYGSQQFQPSISYQQPQAQQPAQSVSGLTFIDNLDTLATLKMPPGSVSQPYFLKDEDKFAVVTFDNVGGSTTELYSFAKVPMPSNDNVGDFVTREYFDQKLNDIMEAINGKHVVPTPAATATAEQQPPSAVAADPATRSV